MATWLVAEGIPIVTENSLRLRSSPLIKGLVCLLHFLEYPAGRHGLLGRAGKPARSQGVPEFAPAREPGAVS